MLVRQHKERLKGASICKCGLTEVTCSEAAAFTVGHQWDRYDVLDYGKWMFMYYRLQAVTIWHGPRVGAGKLCSTFLSFPDLVLFNLYYMTLIAALIQRIIHERSTFVT